MNCFNFKIEYFVQNWSTPDENFNLFVLNCWWGAEESVFSFQFFERRNFKLCLKLKTMLIQSCFWFSNFCYLFDFIHGRYVLKKIRLAKHTEKSKLTAYQEVGWCNKFFHSLHIFSVNHTIIYLFYYK